ncbi:MAG TPA: acyl-CoA carboxylase subunit epsilon [Ornithinibacter sp.]|nr:acyl-CoA carboxylase subunit epsilon [Ornithinibacter sp.]
MTSSPAQSPPGPRPAIVVRGDATPEELAALVAVLSAVSGGDGDGDGDGETASDDTGSTWAAHSAAMRRPVGHGPGAWRTALRP